MRNPVSIRGPRNPVTIRGSRNPVTLSGSKNPVTDNGSRNPVTFVTPVPFTGVDPDAASFFTRAGITDPTQQNAINDLVIQLKNAGIWNSFVALYPFVGGTAGTHSHNLKSSAYQITWNGSPTHSASGVKGDGSTSYGDANFVPSTSGIGLNSTHFSCYINQADSVNGCQMGGPVTIASAEQFQFFQSLGGTTFFDCHGTGTARITGTPPANTGMFTGSRTATNAIALYRNSTSYATASGASETLSSSEVFLFGRSNSGALNMPTDARIALMSIGTGLSTLELSAFYTAVQAYQTALGRQVS